MAFAVLRSDAWDPLFGPLGFAAVLATGIALGFIARRWAVLAAGLVVLPLYGERVLENDPLGLFFAVIVLTPAALALLAAAIAAGRAFPEREARAIGLVALAIGVVLTGIGLHLDWRFVDRSPQEPLVVDERRGTFRGLALGLRERAVRAELGRPDQVETGEDADYLPADASAVRGPSTLPLWRTWRYPGLAVFFAKGQLQGFLLTSDRAQTTRGVGVGDSLDVARRRYSLECDALFPHEGSIPDTPYCAGLVREHVTLWFSGDPIESVWLYRDTSGESLPRLAVR